MDLLPLISKINSSLSDYVLTILLAGAGIYFTCRTRFIQIRCFKEGVKNALSMTIPLGTSVHRRMVYVELEEGASLEAVTQAIKSDSYFSHDETHVIQVPCVDELQDMGHGVLIERKGVSGSTQSQRFAFSMTINNPALTSQILVSCARAVVKQRPGAYTLPEIAPMDMLYGSREALIRELV